MYVTLRYIAKNEKWLISNYALSKFFYHSIQSKPGFEPVALAYASYETTDTQAGEDAPPLIVMHGLFGSKANWNTLCKVLNQKTKPKRKVIAVDARNHGDSPHSDQHTYAHMSADIISLYNELKIKKASLLGHSMGGKVMMCLALDYPDLVDKLIVADISPITVSENFRGITKIMNIMKNLPLPKNMSMGSARIAADKELSKSIKDRGLRSFLLTNLIQKADGSYTWRVNLKSLLSNFNHLSGFPNSANKQFKGPVAFLAGGASDFLQKSDHPQILKLFPNAEFHYIDGAGHWLHSERPNEFLQLCVEFLNRTIGHA